MSVEVGASSRVVSVTMSVWLHGSQGTMVKLDIQPKRSCHLDFLAKISVRHQDKMIACSFVISLRGSLVSTGGQ